jgi:hypothetical protein
MAWLPASAPGRAPRAAFAAASSAQAAARSPFEPHWQDGRAELDGYRFSVVRYGQTRQGTAAMIFVTEPFSTSKAVKVDDPSQSPGDTYEALKLNFVRDFQTGIYDYNTMVSVFVRSRDFAPVKTTFSSAEWCGHVYEEMLYEPHHIADRYSSYFEDESGTRRLRRYDDGVAEENLYILLRGLRGDYLRPGERRRVPFLPGAFYRRLAHRPLAWSGALIERLRGTESVSVPAGRFEAFVYTVRVDGGRDGRFWIESAYPHRIVRWRWSAASKTPRKSWSPAEGTDSGELAGSSRLAYWKLNQTGGESYLREIGLGAPGGGGAKRKGSPSPAGTAR